MQMKNHLPSCPPVILHNSDTFSIQCISNRVRNPLSNFKKISCLFLGNLIDVLVVFFGNHQCVSFVYWAVTQKSHNLLVLVDYACRCLFADYLAENAFRHAVIPFSGLLVGYSLNEFPQTIILYGYFS
jgi:hypothetical protein